MLCKLFNSCLEVSLKREHLLLIGLVWPSMYLCSVGEKNFSYASQLICAKVENLYVEVPQ